MHKSESVVTQSCPTLHDPMDCSPPGSSVHGIFQARVLEWGAIAHWKGAYAVVLTSPTAVKVAGVTPWIHHVRVKRAYHADPEDTERTTQRDPTDPCETKVILKKSKR